MNYYEELGLSRTATHEQVHRAYRTASLLLHPDRQSDPEVAKLAELQMQRLNEVYRILSDPDRRRRYDHSLVSGSIARHVVRRPLWEDRIKQACWYLGAALCVVAISWYISGERIRTTQSATLFSHKADPPSGASIAIKQKPPRRRTGPSKPATTTVVPATAELPPLLPAAAGEREEDAAGRGSSLDEPQPVPAAVTPRAQRFEGTWFYAHPATRTAAYTSRFYAPQFIEAVIKETGPRISGRYSARYTIPDRAISPDVSFRFEGIVEHDEAILTWSGTGGSKGDARIAILAENRIELRWSAAQLGQQLGLSEGRAILIRASPR